jgi:hypothetical protein
MRAIFLAVSLVACGGSSNEDADASAKPTTPAPTAPQDDPVAKEKAAMAAATQSWRALHGHWKTLASTVESKAPKPPCKKAASANAKPGVSIGHPYVIELAAEGAPHNPLMSFGGTTSGRLSDALKLPFTERERPSRDWNPAKAAAALAEIEKGLFPLTVLRLDEFIAPEVTGADTFKPGRARASVFYFLSAESVCSLAVAATSDKTVGALAFDGNTGGPEVVNARLANDLEQSVQRAAGTKLAELGLVASLEPVVPGK